MCTANWNVHVCAHVYLFNLFNFGVQGIIEHYLIQSVPSVNECESKSNTIVLLNSVVPSQSKKWSGLEMLRIIEAGIDNKNKTLAEVQGKANKHHFVLCVVSVS